MIGTRVGLLIALCVVTAGAEAQAQSPSDSAPAPKRDPIAAEALFTRGKQLIDQGHTTEACAAFQESQRLDPAGGTLLRLAMCHESDGKLASAWLEFTEVLRISQAGDSGKLAERVRIAHEHLASIEPRVPKLVVTVPQPSRVDGLTVTADGLPRNESTWGVAIPVDAGTVTIDATAPGRAPFHTVVQTENGRQASVEIPPLDVAPAAAASAAPAGATEAPAPAAHGSSMRPIAFVAGGVGLVALGIGTYFGVTAISKWNDSNAQCGSGCTPQGVQYAHDAKQAAGLADVTVAIGAVGLAAGVVLYFVGAPKDVVQARADGIALKF
jgi:serine/threonine-protein kinase